MNIYHLAMLYFATAASALLLIAGGWVKIRNYFRDKAQAKADDAELAAKEKADEIEAAVQERLKKLQADAQKAPEATATSTIGPVEA